MKDSPMTHIPLPEDSPTITIEEAGKYLGISRSAAYESVKRGTIPSIHLSKRRIVVPVARFREMLGLDVTA